MIRKRLAQILLPCLLCSLTGFAASPANPQAVNPTMILVYRPTVYTNLGYPVSGVYQNPSYAMDTSTLTA